MEHLADIYGDHPKFYDKKIANYYHNQHRRDQIVEEASQKVGLPQLIITNHWKTMRTQFGKLTKERPFGSGKKNLNGINGFWSATAS